MNHVPFRLIPFLVATLVLAGCEPPELLCSSPECVAKSDVGCPNNQPGPGNACDFEGTCYYCEEDNKKALSYACMDGEFRLEGYGFDAETCE